MDTKVRDKMTTVGIEVLYAQKQEFETLNTDVQVQIARAKHELAALEESRLIYESVISQISTKLTALLKGSSDGNIQPDTTATKVS